MVYLGGNKLSKMVDNPDVIEIVEMQIRLPSLDSAFNGMKVIQISDIHMDEWMDQTRLEKIMTMCSSLDHDLLIITGDFLTRSYSDDVDPLIRVLKPLAETMPMIAIVGNNDIRYNDIIIHDILKECKITELVNSVFTLNKGNSSLHFAGLDDVYYGNPDLDLVLDQIPEEGACILLVHEPDFADTSSKTGRFDLQLSGHTHGGQIIIPGIGAPITPPYGHKYISGLNKIGEMLEYTNRGLGFSQKGPKVRINCPPEITLFTLLST